MGTLPLFYQRSTVALIDDDARLLQAISEIIKPTFHTKTYTQPQQYLDFLETHQQPLDKISFLRPCIESDNYATSRHTPVDFDAPALKHLTDHPELAHEISVMIVDYHMPDLSGLELCKKLKNLSIKKILLTGEASHTEAVSAFNQKLINGFLRKDSPTLVQDIQSMVSTLSEEYYRDRTQALLAHLEANHTLPCSDRAFSEFFKSWCQQHNIQQYTLIDKNGCYLGIDHHDQEHRLIVHTDRTLHSFIALNEDVLEASHYLNLVSNREKIPFFGIGKESWELEPSEWGPYFFTPSVLEGREKYYWTSI